MSFDLSWMRPEAPYMPVATIGLLRALEDAGVPATAIWRRVDGAERLHLRTNATPEDVASAVVDTSWPRLDRIWSGKAGQAIKPMLAATPDPAGELRRLRTILVAADADAACAGAERLTGEIRLLRALVTDAVLDGDGLPSRSRLLRGVKADLSGISDRVKLDVASLARELVDGLQWRNGKSGRTLGFAPEAQTFGGTTGREPSSVGCHSVLLHRLLWLGVMALPPTGVMRRGQRVVGGPLVTSVAGGDVCLSWPTWSFAASRRTLAQIFSLPEVHEDVPDGAALRAHGLTSVHRVTSVPINSMIGSFRWAERVV